MDKNKYRHRVCELLLNSAILLTNYNIPQKTKVHIPYSYWRGNFQSHILYNFSVIFKCFSFLNMQKGDIFDL
jgi:hypothetical protein